MVRAADYEAAALMASPVRRALVDALIHRAAQNPDEPGMTASELAPGVDLHVTTVRFHLDQLISAGLVESTFSRRREGAGRPRKVYSVTPATRTGEQAGPLGMLAALLVRVVADSGAGESVTPQEAGRRWVRENVPTDGPVTPAQTPGTWLGRVGRVLDLLDEWGYRPQLATTAGGRTADIELTNCPFFDLARSHEGVVCGVHEGLISEALRMVGETDVEVELLPFIESSRCRAHLRRTTPFRSAKSTIREETP